MAREIIAVFRHVPNTRSQFIDMLVKLLLFAHQLTALLSVLFTSLRCCSNQVLTCSPAGL